MNRVRAEGGKPISVKIDALAQARLAYLAAFYREVLGVDASAGVLVRQALSVLVDESTRLIKLYRKDAESGKVIVAGLAIASSARNNAAPRLYALDEFSEFPTWTEAQALRPHVTLPPINFESDTCTNEQP